MNLSGGKEMEKPKVFIDCRGPSGNVFAILAIVRDALEDAGMEKESKEVRKKFVEIATSGGNYSQILEMFREYVELDLEG